jgi:ketosteroid isomerase-like protein
VRRISEQNVEIARATFEAWNAGDMDALRELYDPGVIMRTPEGWPQPGPFVGREAVMRQFEQVRETWDDDALEPIGEFIDAADRVVLRHIYRGAGRGPESNMELTVVLTVRKRKISYQEFFWDYAEAVEVLGLSDKSSSRANVELFRAYHDEIARAGREGLDPEETISKMAEFWEPEVEYDMSESTVLDIGGVYRGIEAGQQLWREWFTAWEALDFEYELVDAGDRVVVLIDLRMRGRSTRIEVPLGEHAFVTTFRNGLIFQNKLYMNQSEALEAAGLSQSATSSENVDASRLNPSG